MMLTIWMNYCRTRQNPQPKPQFIYLALHPLHKRNNDHNENQKWSLYCALYGASVEVFGDFNHRNPAMNIVRTTIQEITPSKEYRHRLMDFNNQNSFKEIKELLSRSIAKLEAILEEK